MTDGKALLHAYLNGQTLTDDERAALSAWACADPANAALVAQLTHLDASIGSAVRARSLDNLVGMDDTQFLTALRELEDSDGDARPVRIEDILAVQQKGEAGATPNGQSLSLKEIASASAYLGGQLLRTKAGMIGSIAAMLVIAAVLVVSLTGNNDASGRNRVFTGAPIENREPGVREPGRHGPAHNNPAVATLTATHNAQWAERASARGSLTPGSKLHPNQRLTLTAGFAEITTTRGAVAILQAPATIELLDHDNAIRLHSGKMVGICETDSSKGFLVRTVAMDITDLGTRFGVVVEEQGNTLAQVFDGKVVVTPKTQSRIAAEPIELVGGEAHAVDTAGQAIAPQHFEDDAFTSLRLAGSGVVSLVGEADLAPRPIADSDTAAAQKGRVTLYQELRGHRLASAIGLTFATPGRHNDFKQTRSSVPAGTVIRTYILWHPNSGDENLARGRVTFEGEVLGAVANERDWQAFVDATPSAAEQVCPSGRHAGLESVPADHERPNEQFTLSDDRRTLQFQFRSQNTDALRIIVREPAGDQP